MIVNALNRRLSVHLKPYMVKTFTVEHTPGDVSVKTMDRKNKKHLHWKIFPICYYLWSPNHDIFDADLRLGFSWGGWFDWRNVHWFGKQILQSTQSYHAELPRNTNCKCQILSKKYSTVDAGIWYDEMSHFFLSYHSHIFSMYFLQSWVQLLERSNEACSDSW